MVHITISREKIKLSDFFESHKNYGWKGSMSALEALPFMMSSAMARPVAGPFRIPQQLCPVAT